MDAKTRDLFYVSGIFFDLDSADIDQILADAGLDADRDTLDACKAAVRAHIGEEQYREGLLHGRAMWSDDPVAMDREYAERIGIRLVTIAEAARLRGVTVQAISQALDAGRLTTYLDPAASERQGRRLVSRHELGIDDESSA